MEFCTIPWGLSGVCRETEGVMKFCSPMCEVWWFSAGWKNTRQVISKRARNEVTAYSVLRSVEEDGERKRCGGRGEEWKFKDRKRGFKTVLGSFSVCLARSHKTCSNNNRIIPCAQYTLKLNCDLFLEGKVGDGRFHLGSASPRHPAMLGSPACLH